MNPPNEGHPIGVADIQDIRRANLTFLVQESAADIGTDRGANAEVARRTGVAASFISQFLRKKLHQGGFKRSMGDHTARKLEHGMNKPKGWMDVDRLLAADYKEAALLDGLRLLTPAQRVTIGQLIKDFGQAIDPGLSTE